jgi:hypothetical protein
LKFKSPALKEIIVKKNQYAKVEFMKVLVFSILIALSLYLSASAQEITNYAMPEKAWNDYKVSDSNRKAKECFVSKFARDSSLSDDII